MRILLVEDEDSIADPLQEGLEQEGHSLVRVATGEDALDLDPTNHDLILLDMGLPGMDGLAVCREIRRTSSVPIIFISARGAEIDKVLGLELGADDYIVKPFGFRELLARMTAVQRRHAAAFATPQVDRVVIGELCVDWRAHTVSVAGSEVQLTPTEFAVLSELVRNAGAAISREAILQSVWNTTWTSSGKTVDVHVGSLRRKLGASVRIDAVRGVGFRLATPQ